jgi:hypothetical protein
VAGFNVRSGSDVWRDDCKYQTTLSGMITKYSSGANLYLCFEHVLTFTADLFPMTGYYGGGYGGYGRRRYGGCECP